MPEFFRRIQMPNSLANSLVQMTLQEPSVIGMAADAIGKEVGKYREKRDKKQAMEEQRKYDALVKEKEREYQRDVRRRERQWKTEMTLYDTLMKSFAEDKIAVSKDAASLAARLETEYGEKVDPTSLVPWPSQSTPPGMSQSLEELIGGKVFNLQRKKKPGEKMIKLDEKQRFVYRDFLYPGQTHAQEQQLTKWSGTLQTQKAAEQASKKTFERSRIQMAENFKQGIGLPPKSPNMTIPEYMKWIEDSPKARKFLGIQFGGGSDDLSKVMRIAQTGINKRYKEGEVVSENHWRQEFAKAQSIVTDYRSGKIPDPEETIEVMIDGRRARVNKAEYERWRQSQQK